ncbi:MAG: hypothetical protein AB2L11_03760 [Syntrophobacteraceae bacterium]
MAINHMGIDLSDVFEAVEAAQVTILAHMVTIIAQLGAGWV